MNIPYYLEMYSRKTPESTFLKTETSEYTFREMNDQANRLASSLARLGIKKGDKVILLLKNGYEFAVSYFAVLKLGAVVIPTNVKLTANEVKVIFDDSGAKAIIVEEERKEDVNDFGDCIYICAGEGNKTCLSLDELIAQGQQVPFESQFTEDDISTILYTSGTTGKPKGVVFQNRSILSVAQMICIEMKMTEFSKTLLMMPLSHSAPLHLFFISTLMVGATAVTRKEFHPLELLKAIETEKITHFFGAPVAYLLAAKILEQQKFDLSSMEWFVYGGAPIGANEVRYIQKVFETDRLTGVYGLTEAGPSGSLLFPEEHDKKAGSVGRRASLFTELKIVDEKGDEVGPNEIGEVVLRGLGMMKEYYNNPEATEKAFIDGWLRTGDLGRYDEDGYIWIVDRVKDIIISGGVNIYPFEVEQELMKYEPIQDVAVVGVPHPEWGETVKAFYVSDAPIDEADVKAFLSTRLAAHKIPRMYEKIDAIPRNATGKILKHQLRKEYELK